MPKPVARLTNPAQMVAALPLHLGFTPTESIVVVCCYEPRGRMGLTMRFDLPAPKHESLLASDIEDRVRHQKASRVLIAIYTAEPDGETRVRRAMVEDLRARFADLVVTDIVLVRDERFWSYVCDNESCCPAAGTPVDTARESSSVRMLEAERVLEGRVQLPDREALEASLAGPTFLAAQVAAQRCDAAMIQLADTRDEAGHQAAGDVSLQAWSRAVLQFGSPPADLTDHEAAALAVSLFDVAVRDELAGTPAEEVPALLRLLDELIRRTPAPYDAPVCTLFAWLTYCEGGGAAVTIALERALHSDPDYNLARILDQALLAQVPPDKLRELTRASFQPRRRVA